MSEGSIRIRGARTHNLKDLDLDLPRQALIVVCGVSGSGKSSLVLDTLGAESRRRFLGTLSRTGRDGPLDARPEVDAIEGLPPAIAAGFLARRPDVRQTLGTLTEITHALRALFARAATPYCPTCGDALVARNREQVAQALLSQETGTRVVLLAHQGEGPSALEDARRNGFVRVRLAGDRVMRIEEIEGVGDEERIDVVVDRLVVKEGADDRFRASVEQGLDLGGGVLRVLIGKEELTFADRPFCGRCEVTWPPLSTATLSFDSPAGACPACQGRGCDTCEDTRLTPFARAACLDGHTLPEAEALEANELHGWLEQLELDDPMLELGQPAREDALARAGFLEEVGLGYLQPSRAASTLSGGELRRARLAAACAARMSGLLFLLDEPTAGLHPSERHQLRRRLRALVDEGNTVLCVEHDPSMLEHADHVIELGKGAGRHGGEILAQGPASKILREKRAPIVRALDALEIKPRGRRRRKAPSLHVRGAVHRTLKGIDVEVPLAALTCITGPSGAGKSTLLLDVLAPAAQAILDRKPLSVERLAALEGAKALARVSVARGNPPRHPRATPGSVLGVMPRLRRLFALTLDARTRGWSPSRFSRHVKGGRCEVCKGLGERRLELRELAPVRVGCDACGETGFARDTLRVRVKGLSIADVLTLPIGEAAEVFRDIPGVAGPLRAAADVGLGYIPLGEPTSRLSGGEALRLRLAAALGRGGEGRTLYCLDEPSAGLHPIDVGHLKKVLLGLAKDGNAIVCVEHHPILVRDADHVIELGPGPGEEGGQVTYEGAPAGADHSPGS